MSDIVERLSKWADALEGDEGDLMREAADEIDRLRAELKTIRPAVVWTEQDVETWREHLG